MINNNINFVDWATLFILIFLGLMFLQQSWANLIQKNVSILSLDRLAVILSELFANSEHKAETRRLSKDPSRLMLQGVLALLFFMGALREIYKWIILNIVNN